MQNCSGVQYKSLVLVTVLGAKCFARHTAIEYNNNNSEVLLGAIKSMPDAPQSCVWWLGNDGERLLS